MYQNKWPDLMSEVTNNKSISIKCNRGKTFISIQYTLNVLFFTKTVERKMETWPKAHHKPCGQESEVDTVTQDRPCLPTCE